MPRNLKTLSKKTAAATNESEKKLKNQCNDELYEVKIQQLQDLEALSCLGQIDLFYGDETHISEQGYVPYGWQFADENVFIPVKHGKKMNCFGILSRNMNFHYRLSEKSIKSDFIMSFLDEFSWTLTKPTVIVLDNARIHQAKIIAKQIHIW